MSRARAKEATSPQQEMTHNMMTRSKTRAREMDPDYDCLENNPRCPCGLLLNEDDMGVWQEDESKTPMCEACLYEMENESDDNDSDDDSNDDSDDDSEDLDSEAERKQKLNNFEWSFNNKTGAYVLTW